MKWNRFEWEIVLATITNWRFKYTFRWMVKLRHRSNKIQSKRIQLLWYWHLWVFVDCYLWNAYIISNTGLCIVPCVHRCTIGCAAFVMLNYGVFFYWIEHTTMVWSTSFNWNEFQVCFFYLSSILSWACAWNRQNLKIYTLPIVKLISSEISMASLARKWSCFCWQTVIYNVIIL